MIEQLGKYRIDGVLGEGAMGIVYKGFDLGIERAVALKTIRKEMFAEGEQAELVSRFKNEAQVAGRLSHPNIVTVYDYGEEAGAAYIAMEYVEGCSLDKLLLPDAPTAVPQVLAWLGGLLGALDYAHSRGVVHRDVKPGNLLIGPDGQVKVSDFGVAHIESSTLSRAGSMIGTPSYMSPEQLRGDAIDGRSDLFSAGIVLYQLLTGARPFSGPAAIVMQRILNEDPLPPSAVLGTLGTRFDQVLAISLAKRPDQRYTCARSFHEALLVAAGVDPGAAFFVDPDRTVLAPGTAAGGGAPGVESGWKRETLSEIEACLAHQIGPMAKTLLNKVADRAEDLEHLTQLLAPHIPSEGGRARFREALATIGGRLVTAAGNGPQAAPPGAHATDPVCRGPLPGPGRVPGWRDFDQADADAATRRLVAIVGPIGRVLARRAMEQAQDRQAFLLLLASNIDNPGERTRFLLDAGVPSRQESLR